MIRLKDLMKENSSGDYKYGCAMIYFTFPELFEIQKLIKKDDIFEGEDLDYGLEDEPHATLLYGLHDEEVSVEQVESLIDKYTYTTCKVHNPSLFENPMYDVLKFEVEGNNLHEINGDLRNLPHTTRFPDYNPHLTVSYINSGEGQKYVDYFNKNGLNEYMLVPEYVIYSEANKTKHKISIKVD